MWSEQFPASFSVSASAGDAQDCLAFYEQRLARSGVLFAEFLDNAHNEDSWEGEENLLREHNAVKFW